MFKKQDFFLAALLIGELEEKQALTL